MIFVKMKLLSILIKIFKTNRILAHTNLTKVIMFHRTLLHMKPIWMDKTIFKMKEFNKMNAFFKNNNNPCIVEINRIKELILQQEAKPIKHLQRAKNRLLV